MKDISIDVFSMKNENPFLAFRMIVREGIIISVNNVGLAAKGEKTGSEDIGEYLNITPLSKLERHKLNGQLNFKFKLHPLSINYLYLNLTQKEIRALSKQDNQFRQFVRLNYFEKLFKKKFNGFWVWVGRLGMIVTLLTPFLPLVTGSNQIQKSIPERELKTSNPDSIRNDSIMIEIDTTKQKTNLMQQNATQTNK
ncbi:MAG: hypothetical protein PF448_11865 [Bacteroidales bacterium]|jgi:hypothetical protein|nr:hypothetical protein [Bacteroidales bacterium]